MDSYKAGSGPQQIVLTVDIDTFGLAATRAVVVDMQSTDPGNTVAVSDNATGDIPPAPIGSADSLKGKRLSVFTKIDLLGDEASRKKEIKRLSGTYILDNGIDGHKVFGKPEKIVTDDLFTVFLHKKIDLTA
jgi:hypothetical protein